MQLGCVRYPGKYRKEKNTVLVRSVGPAGIPPPDPRAAPFLELNYLFYRKRDQFDWLEDVCPSGHAEGPVDPFLGVWVASKVKQHLRVVEQGWLLLRVGEEPKEELPHKAFQPNVKMHALWPSAGRQATRTPFPSSCGKRSLAEDRVSKTNI